VCQCGSFRLGSGQVQVAFQLLELLRRGKSCLIRIDKFLSALGNATAPLFYGFVSVSG
jgi:hypothetical protein